MYPRLITINKLPQKQKGIGLPGTIFLIVILALVVVAMSDLTETSNQGFAQDYESVRAFYASESGIQVALNRVFVGGEVCSTALSDIDFDAAGSNAGLDNCITEIQCRVVSVAGTDYMTFNSTATCGTGLDQAQRSIEVRAHD
jgi:MSHA biogenesis protein MshP